MDSGPIHPHTNPCGPIFADILPFQNKKCKMRKCKNQQFLIFYVYKKTPNEISRSFPLLMFPDPYSGPISCKNS